MRVWYRRFEYASNAKIIWASKLLTKMGDLSTDYKPAEIYNDSEVFESEILTIDNTDLLSK